MTSYTGSGSGWTGNSSTTSSWTWGYSSGAFSSSGASWTSSYSTGYSTSSFTGSTSAYFSYSITNNSYKTCI